VRKYGKLSGKNVMHQFETKEEYKKRINELITAGEQVLDAE